MFTKILVANRGEIAVRIIRACQEMGIAAVAVYSEADAQALHVALADAAFCIGPPPPGESYLAGDRIVQAALESGCQAVHPGYGFLAENAGFADAVQAAGLTFIGPSAAAMRIMGSKTAARAAMQAAGLPVVPGYQASQAAADLQAAAAEMGYPVLVKASAGGGGKGMRAVRTAADLPHALESARREAQNAFGDGRIYLEKLIERPRHIEFQLFADHHGHAVHLFERECSVQRRHQTIVEEAPSPFLDEDLRSRMGEAAVAAIRAVGYTNAGTLEFLVDEQRNFYFLEMNTRLQVEHPVTEALTGVDLVKLQIRTAAGEPLPFAQNDLRRRGHAIECRVYAEDPANGFLPAVGRVLEAAEPVGPGVRVDAGVTSGDEVTLHYDPMIAKLIVHAETRPDAIGKLLWALNHYVILGDLTTNLPFLRAVVDHPAFRAGATDTGFIDSHLAGWQPPAGDPPDLALAVAALAEHLGLADTPAPAAPGLAAAGEPPSPWRSYAGWRLGA